MLDAANASSHSERDERLLSGRIDELVGRVAVFRRRGDVEEGEFIGTCGVISMREFYRISGVTEIFEVDAFDDSAVIDIQAWDDANCSAHNFPRGCWVRGGWRELLKPRWLWRPFRRVRP